MARQPQQSLVANLSGNALTYALKCSGIVVRLEVGALVAPVRG